MDFNFPLKFNTEKNGESLNGLCIVLGLYVLFAILALVNLFSGFGLLTLVGVAIAVVQLLGAYNAAFFRENGRKLLLLTNLVNMAWGILSFIVNTIRWGFSFSNLLNSIINFALLAFFSWYLEQKKALFDQN